MILLPFTLLFWIQVYTPFLCFLSREDPYSIWWRSGFVVLNSLSFCLPVKLLISPSYLNEILAGYSNLGCRLFSFITLSMSREKQQITHKGIPIRITADLSIETLRARREWQDIHKVMKEKNLQPRLLYPARISFKYEGEIKKALQTSKN